MISKLAPGEPIDLALVNLLIDRLNRLEDADKLGAYSSNLRVYSTTDDNMLVQGLRKKVAITKLGNGYYGNSGKITFPKPFSDIPIITATPDSSGNYLVPYLGDITPSSFNINFVRVSDSWADVPKYTFVNIIAVGPVAAS